MKNDRVLTVSLELKTFFYRKSEIADTYIDNIRFSMYFNKKKVGDFQ